MKKRKVELVDKVESLFLRKFYFSRMEDKLFFMILDFIKILKNGAELLKRR